jgi:hypothetical protein
LLNLGASWLYGEGGFDVFSKPLAHYFQQLFFGLKSAVSVLCVPDPYEARNNEE